MTTQFHNAQAKQIAERLHVAPADIPENTFSDLRAYRESVIEIPDHERSQQAHMWNMMIACSKLILNHEPTAKALVNLWVARQMLAALGVPECPVPDVEVRAFFENQDTAIDAKLRREDGGKE